MDIYGMIDAERFQMNYLLEIYRKIVPERVRKTCNEWLQKQRISRDNRRDMERKNCGDKNKKETFYVIRTDSTQRWGIATTCSMVLNGIKYAVDRGWIPVIDYQNYFLVGIQDEGNRGKENAWEYYFEQPDPRYSLEEVYRSRNVILGPVRGQPHGSLSWNDIKDVLDDRYIPYFDCAAKYLRMKPEIIKRAEEMRQTLFGRAVGEKILGVGMRAGLYWGTVLKSSDYNGHPGGLSIDEYIEMAHKYMGEFDCGYIFVSCDDRYYLERMKQEFGEKCLYMSGRTLAHFFDEEGKPIREEKDRAVEFAAQGERERTTDYLIEIYLLSICDSLFRVQGGGSLLACLLNNRKYEHYYLADRGTQ